MCGIVGRVGPGAGAELAGLRRALDVLRPRGPDARGEFGGDDVLLGHTRLAILDLTETGAQPMRCPDGRHVLVYNGEIYGHLALRRRLESEGVRFRGTSDTETVLHWLLSRGAAGLADLRGMFALALVDTATGETLLARDALGIKPLYWTHDGRTLSFASELKALLVAGWTNGRLDRETVDHLLAFYVVPSPRAAVEGVHTLRPGEVLHFAADGTRTRHALPELAFAARPDLQLDDAVPLVRTALEEAVESHLLSDVPVGVFLSGGVDSGAVALLAARASDEPLHAFTLTYGDEGAALQEDRAAAAVARHGGLIHHTATIDGEHVARCLPRVLWAMDEPAGSAVPNWFVAEMAAREGAKVCLSGLGGDELFAGYARYVHLARRERWFDAWSRTPAFLRSVAGGAARMLGGRAAAFVDKADQPFGRRSFGYKLVLDQAAKSRLWNPDVDRSGWTSTRDLLLPLFEEVADQSIVDQIAYVDAKTYLANDLLRHTDGMTMAHSIEARVPLLDRPLVDLAFSLPPELRLHGEVRKHVLREAVRDLFPAGHLERPKQGFSFPMEAWMRDGPLRPVVDAALADAVVERRGLFRPEAVRELRAAFRRAPVGGAEAQVAAMRVWTLTVLELWQRMMLDDAAPRSPDVPLEELLA